MRIVSHEYFVGGIAFVQDIVVCDTGIVGLLIHRTIVQPDDFPNDIRSAPVDQSGFFFDENLYILNDPKEAKP